MYHYTCKEENYQSIDLVWTYLSIISVIRIYTMELKVTLENTLIITLFLRKTLWIDVCERIKLISFVLQFWIMKCPCEFWIMKCPSQLLVWLRGNHKRFHYSLLTLVPLCFHDQCDLHLIFNISLLSCSWIPYL